MGSCELLGTFGIIVQLILGVLSFMVLVGCLFNKFVLLKIYHNQHLIKQPLIRLIVKRHLERPKRLWKVFAMDTSKQVFSQLSAHVLNVGLATILSSSQEGDPCIWYFITFILDSTIGVAICYFILMFFEKIFEQKGIQKFKTGNYYEIIYPKITTYAIDSKNLKPQKTKPQVIIDFEAYFLQLSLWMLIVILSKVFLYFIQVLLAGFFKAIADFIFSPISNNPQAELVIIMIVIPLIVNAIIFWVQDNFLKKNEINRKERDLLMGVIYENDQAKPQTGEILIEFKTLKPQIEQPDSNTEIQSEKELNNDNKEQINGITT